PCPHLRIAGRQIPVLLPSLHDARLKLSAVIVILQILGQTLLEFKVSIAQILVTVGFCAIIDTTVTLLRQGVLTWPASALLTGNSTAFILRASGTQHGDWWSLRGIHLFILAAGVALLVKYVVRPGGRHRFNPSNVGLVMVLIFIGPSHVFPQYLWWGPLAAPVITALVVIGLGAVYVLRAVRMVGMATAFLAVFAAVIAVLAAGGRSFVAIWSAQPISGASYWVYICTSPELLIFVFFMMSDPATAAKGKSARVAFGSATGIVAGLLVSLQPTEYGVKVAILAALTVVCACVPTIEALSERFDRIGREPRSHRSVRLVRPRPVTIGVAMIAMIAVAGTAQVAADRELLLIEQGLTRPGDAQ
ncbi:MAG: hypothetical protein ACRDMZ_19170, partial [Solirubrobacteraceae bacterium]